MIDLIIDKRTRDLGGGFEIVPAFAKRRMVGLSSFRPDGSGGFRTRHPQAGRAPASAYRPVHRHYLYSGAMTHRDSLGFAKSVPAPSTG